MVSPSKYRIIFFTQIFIFIVFCNIQSAEYIQSSISWKRAWHKKISYYDINGDGLKDIILSDFRELNIYLQGKEKGFNNQADYYIQIPPKYSHFCFYDISGDKAEELILLAQDGIFFERIEQGISAINPKPLINTELAVMPRKDYVYHTRFFVPLSKDGRMGIIVPQNDKYVIYEFNKGQDLKKKWEFAFNKREINTFKCFKYNYGSILFSNSNYRISVLNYNLGNEISIEDKNNDELSDFICNEQIYLQQADGCLNEQITSGTKEMLDDYTLSNDEDLLDRNLYIDIDGDGVVDTVTYKVDEDFFRAKTEVKIFFGRKEKNGVQKNQDNKPDSKLITKGVPCSFSLSYSDFNNDKAIDLVFFNIDIEPASASSHVKAFVERGLTGHLLFYLWEKGKGYPSSPNFKLKIPVSYDIYGFRSLEHNQILYNTDFTGDPYPDLVIKVSKNEIGIFKYIDEKTGFSQKPYIVLTTSNPIHSLETFEFNNDNKDDIIARCYDVKDYSLIINNFFISH